MFKKIFCFSVIFLALQCQARAAQLKNFHIEPDYLFTDDDVGVRFTVTVLSQGSEKPKNITLMEIDDEAGKIKYRWPLMDDGTKGDEKAGDGVYNRDIQFKEHRPKKILFYVVEEQTDEKGIPSQSESLPSVTENQRAVLEIRAHPTMIDILKSVWEKIKKKFE